MQTSPRRRPSSRRSGSSGSAAGLIVAVLALVGAMGLTALRRAEQPAGPAAPPTPTAVRAPELRPEPAPTPRVRAPKPSAPLDRVAAAVRAAEGRLREVRGMRLGAGREQARVHAMAELSAARQTLGSHLDAAPDDLRANRLWDRLQRAYIALKKL